MPLRKNKRAAKTVWKIRHTHTQLFRSAENWLTAEKKSVCHGKALVERARVRERLRKEAVPKHTHIYYITKLVAAPCVCVRARSLHEKKRRNEQNMMEMWTIWEESEMKGNDDIIRWSARTRHTSIHTRTPYREQTDHVTRCRITCFDWYTLESELIRVDIKQ